MSPWLPAQDSQDAQVQELLRQLKAEREARLALERRVDDLERQRREPSSDQLEDRLRLLVAPGDLEPAGPRSPTSPSFYNPTVGVFMDSRIDAGNFDTRLDEDTDNFSLRETEIDLRLPLSPFAEGVAIIALENEEGEFETVVEEGYASIDVGTLLDVDVDTTARIGRFRPMFGRNNALHLHDWLQTNLPLAMRNLVGEEGLVGEGLALRQPLWGGEGQATNLDLAIVNGDLLAGHGSPLDEIAEDAGTEMASDGELLVARASHFTELGEGGLSDIEFGVSRLGRLAPDAVETESGAEIDTTYWDFDVTWRSRQAEHGVGSWLVQAETVRAQLDDDGAGLVGDERESGWWLTVQRQVSPNVYLGVLYSESDVLASDAEQDSVQPYVSWYADEFFRVRAGIEHLTQDGNGSEEDFADANRLLLQFTWNFGAHQPHPYWVNR
ncbi:MAG: hypothetical protein FJ296_05270 [Planctomycetes bacterium]|nr:hypothetical protein [Planctomycetota bacterium]